MDSFVILVIWWYRLFLYWFLFLLSTLPELHRSLHFVCSENMNGANQLHFVLKQRAEEASHRHLPKVFQILINRHLYLLIAQSHIHKNWIYIIHEYNSSHIFIYAYTQPLFSKVHQPDNHNIEYVSKEELEQLKHKLLGKFATMSPSIICHVFCHHVCNVNTRSHIYLIFIQHKSHHIPSHSKLLHNIW